MLDVLLDLEVSILNIKCVLRVNFDGTEPLLLGLLPGLLVHQIEQLLPDVLVVRELLESLRRHAEHRLQVLLRLHLLVHDLLVLRQEYPVDS